MSKMYAVASPPPPPPGTDHRTGMAGSSPIPQQWWDQDARAGQQKTPDAMRPAYGEGVDGTNDVNNHTQQQTVINPNTISPSMTTPGISNVAKPIDRPSLRSPSPTIQKRLENAAPTTFRGANGKFPNYRTPVEPAKTNEAPKPSATGLIRLTLNKPMGIVFEPMTDPHNSSQQRGVRICDLPRTGAAALSRKLEVGDELLSINNKTVSRLTFDEIMDIIIEANPEGLNLLFRRPRKDQLKASAGVGNNTPRLPTGPAAMIHNTNSNTERAGVKWKDDHDVAPTFVEEKKKVKISERKKKTRFDKDDESTMTGDSSRYTVERMDARERKHRRAKRREYNSESFLDMLIDSICAPIVGQKHHDRDDEYSDDEGTLYSEGDSTYNTYEEPKSKKKAKEATKAKERGRGKKSRNEKYNEKYNDDDDDDEGTLDDDDNDASEITDNNEFRGKIKKTKSPVDLDYGTSASLSKSTSNENDILSNSKRVGLQLSTSDVIYEEEEQVIHGDRYEDDATLETVESRDRGGFPRDNVQEEKVSSPPPLGLNPQVRISKSLSEKSGKSPKQQTPPKQEDSSTYIQDKNIPMSELEFDQFDHGADVSVMESVGGPSLLLEARRHNAAANAGIAAARATSSPVNVEIMAQYGLDYPAELGSTREETIQQDPNKYYQHVVRNLLEKNEPEKVRLLDKLLSKYKGREPHLIQKLSARYERQKEEEELGQLQKGKNEPKTNDINDNDDGFQTFGAFPKVNSKDVNNAFDAWPPIESENETKASSSKEGKERSNEEDSHSSYTDSDFSGDSIDGTSPAVIAQVSELLNYVYGKTSVPGQIDRVSTIMRAYEGREAILLELLETKALLKANSDKEEANNLPAVLRNNPGLNNREISSGRGDLNNGAMSSPISGITAESDDKDGDVLSGNIRNTNLLPTPSTDSESKLDGRSNITFPKSFDSMDKSKENYKVTPNNKSSKSAPSRAAPKKKKGIFRGIFKKNKNKDHGGSFPNSDGRTSGKGNKKILSPKGGKKGVLLGRASSEASI